IAANFILVFLGVAGVRVLRRILGEHADLARRKEGTFRETVPTMLVGAGAGGVLMTKELANRPDLGLRAVGFLDDDRDKVGTVVNGVPVLGTTDQLAELSERHGALQILITMASAPGSTVRRISKLAE